MKNKRYKNRTVANKLRAVCIFSKNFIYKVAPGCVERSEFLYQFTFLFTLQIYLRLQVSDSNKFFAFLSSSIKTLTFRVNLLLTRSHFYKMQILYFSTIILLKMTNCHWILYTVVVNNDAKRFFWRNSFNKIIKKRLIYSFQSLSSSEDFHYIRCIISNMWR